jgi:hypothetical protein
MLYIPIMKTREIEYSWMFYQYRRLQLKRFIELY